MDKPLYSIVIPFKNEEENISTLLQELIEVMEQLKAPWEAVLVNDGSTDRTGILLQEWATKRSEIHPLHFSHNFGQSSAFDAGFKACRGEWVITLDGDGQNDPRDIPKLAAMRNQADLICGWRIARQDNNSKRLTSKIANSIRSRVCSDGMHDTGCSLKLMRRSALAQIKLYHGMHRFLPALFVIEGFTVTEVTVRHRPRLRGKSHYHFFNRSIGPLFDLFAVWWMRKRALKYTFHNEP